jgi:tripartite-type tricarboxylate transporter receptor subunit TctC
VRLIVGFPPGGVGDISSRLIGQWLSDRLGQPFVIENRPGAASNIATEAVVKAPPDGYTLLHVSTTNAINATLYDKLNFRRDIAPVAGIIRAPLVMVVNPSVPAKTVYEFIAYAKANPGRIAAGDNALLGEPRLQSFPSAAQRVKDGRLARRRAVAAIFAGQSRHRSAARYPPDC